MTDEEFAAELEAIAEKYEEKKYFARLKAMFKGLGQPHDTPEYKAARTELQRQAAPLIALVSVILFVIILIVVTSIKSSDKEAIVITRMEEDKVEEQQEEEEEPPEPPEDPPEIPPEEIDTTVEVLDPSPVSNMTPSPSPPSPNVSVKPAPTDTVRIVKAPVMMKSMAGSRNPGAIGARTGGGAGYGDPSTEAAVLKVLWWLKATQKTDGSWDPGAVKGGAASRVATTALAILTYLAHGEYEGSESPYRGEFGPVVSMAINYLVSCLDTRDPNHPTMRGADGNEYAFLIATYALCEAYGMTRNPICKETAMVTLSRIIKGQSSTGGWDYKINPQSTRDDLSFAGWALQALKAGKMSGMHPDGLDECIKKAIKCLKTRSFKSDHFAYCAGGNQHPGLTATGCLAMQLLGYTNESEVRKSLGYMKDWQPSFTKKDSGVGNDCPSPQYYCYYATQCKYQAGMREGANKADEEIWHKWNASMKKLYTGSITDLPERVKDARGKDHKQGYYPANKGEDTWTNDVMNSCLVALQLMVYYRYLPTNQLSATAAAPEGDAAEAMTDSDDVNVDVDI